MHRFIKQSETDRGLDQHVKPRSCTLDVVKKLDTPGQHKLRQGLTVRLNLPPALGVTIHIYSNT
jgi:hypothetical protein